MSAQTRVSAARTSPPKKDDRSAPENAVQFWAHLAIFYLLFTVPLILVHAGILELPFFWDEHGQFIPTALDLLRHGLWVAHSTLPNIHPPGVEAFLVIWYKIFGYSILVTRFAMLTLAGAGLLGLFLLAVELSRRAPGSPAFLPPVLLLVSPLFYTQSFMAQLDMPAMVLTLFALWLFIRRRFALSSLFCVALVLVKETGAVTPAVFFLVLLWRREVRNALWFLIAPLALGVWLVVLHHSTGYWMGNPGFENYNVSYSLRPVRVLLTIARRLYYLFFAEFRWIGTLAIVLCGKRLRQYRSDKWSTVALVFGANLALVIFFGGAALERYLLPVLPLFYIAVSLAMSLLPRWQAVPLAAALLVGLAANLFWNPPYPAPYENNYAMVDFVGLESVAATFVEHQYPSSTIATAWPYTSALSNPDFGYVTKPMRTVETNDLHYMSVAAVPPAKYDILIVYTRTWAPHSRLLALPWVRNLLRKYYEFEPTIDQEQCRALGLRPVVSWERRGQSVDIYQRASAAVKP